MTPAALLDPSGGPAAFAAMAESLALSIAATVVVALCARAVLRRIATAHRAPAAPEADSRK